MLNQQLNLNPQLFSSSVEKEANRVGFGKALLEFGKMSSEAVALSGDLTESTRVIEFANEFPDRFIECGVAEQNMMGVAAGLALVGKIPFVASYATFSPGRSWDQLRVSVCYSNANVKIIGCHAGLSVGPDGATHQALEDIAITRALPNLTVVVPCDTNEAYKATLAIGSAAGPSYLRLAREKTPIITTESTPFSIGRAEIIKEGSDVAIIASGPILHEAILAAAELSKQNISALVINNHTIKPLDEATIIWAAKMAGCVVTAEDHQVYGGAGSAVAESLAQNYPVPIEFIGMRDTFGESGQMAELMEKFGLSSRAIVKASKKVILRKHEN